VKNLEPETEQRKRLRAARRCKEFFQTAQQNSFAQNCRLAVEALTVGSMAMLEKEK
jgi:hypothetical protein